MRPILTIELEPGQILAQAIHNERGSVLLAAGVTLTPRYIEFLRSSGFSFVFVEDAATADIDMHDVVSERVRRTATHSLYRVYATLEKAAQFARNQPPEAIRKALGSSEYRDRVGELDGYERLCAAIESIVDEG